MFAIFLTEGMNPFYQNIASFPTIVFTFVLLLVVLYWLIAILGFIDIDFLDFDLPDAEGAMEINPDTGMSTSNVLGGMMLRYGLAGIPVTIIISFITLFGWLICYYAAHFLLGFVPSGFFRFLIGIPILLGSLYLAVLITSVIIRPLRPLFQKAQQETVKKVLGQTVVVRTSRVDNDFGEANLEDGGAGLILKVRTKGDQVFAKGDRVVLLERLDGDNIYRVISEAEFMGKNSIH